jgi:diadenylate cyclase
MHNVNDVINQINWLTALKLFVQTVIICYCVIWIWKRILGTQAERLVKGVMVLIAVCVLSYYAGFTVITSILQQLIPVAVIALLIIFQPEVRRGLGYIGRMKPFSIDFSLPNSGAEKAHHDIEQIIGAVRELSRNKIGALVVVEPPEGERDYLSPGTPINADISSALILSIFYPNSPLHDGALVVREDKIVAAGVILPMTDDPKLSYRYGTRHRAAIGLSEIYDGLCIVVSEETGAISAANRGMLVRYNEAAELADPLAYLYHQHGHSENTATGPLSSFLTLFSKGKRDRSLETQGAPAGLSNSSPVVAPKLTDVSMDGHVELHLNNESAGASVRPPEPEQVI